MNSKRSFCVAFIAASALFFSQERNLRNIQKLTFGGDNAEAYFSPDGKKLTLQVTNPAIGAHCDQIYLLDLNQKDISTKNLNLISTGTGRTTCSFFMPDGKHILYASTHEANKECPPKPKPRTDGKYLWPVYAEFDIYEADLNGKITKKLTDSPGYDAEAVVSPDGKYIVFTSTRSGDLELWRMDIDGKNLKQLTFGMGYDGGAFFSHDSKKLVFRSSRPTTTAEIKEYKDLLAENLVAPTNMEIYTCNVDGSDLKQVTHLGKANWAPFFHPGGKKIVLLVEELFKDLGKDDIMKIVDLELVKTLNRGKEIGFSIEILDSMKEHLVEVGYDPAFGARPLKRAIQRWIDDSITEFIIENDPKQDTTLIVSYDKDTDKAIVEKKKKSRIKKEEL